ncbi:MAG: hypothetical protein AAF423_05770 [Pseudomonadota bacterium]
MKDKNTATKKDQKLKSALRENLKKRKQLTRKLIGEEPENKSDSVKLRSREISATEIE